MGRMSGPPMKMTRPFPHPTREFDNGPVTTAQTEIEK